MDRLIHGEKELSEALGMMEPHQLLEVLIQLNRKLGGVGSMQRVLKVGVCLLANKRCGWTEKKEIELYCAGFLAYLASLVVGWVAKDGIPDGAPQVSYNLTFLDGMEHTGGDGAVYEAGYQDAKRIFGREEAIPEALKKLT